LAYRPGEELAVIAGAGRLPVLAARRHAASGGPVFVVALEEEPAPELVAVADDIVRHAPGEVGRILRRLRRRGIRQLLFVGKVFKGKLFRGLRLDLTALKLWVTTSRRSDRGIMDRLCELAADSGLEVVSQLEVLGDLLVGEGLLTRRKPGAEEAADAELGLRIAAASSRLGIGQSVVVRGGVVVAVEALEGTDACLARAGELARGGGKLFRGGLVLAKVAGDGHDPRFDVPTVGCRTLENAAAAGVTCLALESGMTLIADDLDVFTDRADELDLSVLGLTSPQSAPADA
jgi:hypothetical protein